MILKIDLCLSVSFGPLTVTLPTAALFEALDTKPNYTSFFSSTLKLNEKLFSSTTYVRSALGKRLSADKINLYSTIEGLFVFDRSQSVRTQLSAKVILSSIEERSVFKTSAKTVLHKIEEEINSFAVKAREKASGEYPYRLEVTINYADFDAVIDILKSFLTKQNFISHSSVVFTGNIAKTISSFGELIRPTSPYSLEQFTKSLLAELILRHVYIDGCPGVPLVPAYAHDALKAAVTHSDFPVVHDMKQIITAVHASLTCEDRKKMILKMISYAFVSKTLKGVLLAMLPEMHYSCTAPQALDLILRSHAMEMLDSPTVSLSSLQTSGESTINFLEAARRLFITNKPGTATMAKLLSTMAMNKFGWSFSDLVNNLMTHSQQAGITCFFLTPRSGPISLSYDRSLGTRVYTPRQLLFEKYNSLLPNLRRGRPCMETGDAEFDELARLLIGLYVNRPPKCAQRFQSMIGDTCYGFHHCRNAMWCRNKIGSTCKLVMSILKQKDLYLRLIRKMKAWKPSKFTLEERVNYIRRVGGFEMSPECRAEFEKLLAIDMAAWEVQKYHEELNSLPGVTILEVVMPPAMWAFLNKEEMVSWDAEIPLLIPVPTPIATANEGKATIDVADTINFPVQEMMGAGTREISGLILSSADERCHFNLEYMLGYIRRMFGGSEFTANTLRSKFTSKVRPTATGMANFLNQLEEANYLSVSYLPRRTVAASKRYVMNLAREKQPSDAPEAG